MKFFGHSKNAAEELIKRVFVSAFEQIDAYPEAGTFILWLRTITVYEVRKGDIEESIASHEAGAVEKAILSLPIEERVIFVLHDVDKLRLEEITIITKDSEEHIEIELERARKLMMNRLRIKQFDDLDYKISFLPQKVEPAPQFWKVVLNVINKTEPENPEVNEEKKDSIGKKLLGLFKKES